MKVATADVRVMGVHPIGCGFGWVVCEGPFKLIESGLVTSIKKGARLKNLREFERLFARLRPAELVLESLDAPTARRCDRARTLGLDLVSAAADRGLMVEAHPRAAVQQAFEAIGAVTREQIAEVVARHFPALAYRLPKKRSAWEGEVRRMAIFNAAAVVLAHFHNGATALLDDLRDAA